MNPRRADLTSFAFSTITLCLSGFLISLFIGHWGEILPEPADANVANATDESVSSVLLQDVSVSTGHSLEQKSTAQFAIIGDFGVDSYEASGVANLVKGWNPDFIATVGDNNYPNGSMGAIDDNVGQYYHQYIYNYIGTHGSGADQPRFFPALGNHDWESIFCNELTCRGPYFDYFGIDPVTDRYYTVQIGPVRIFMLNSNAPEPDGISGISTQAVWLKEQLALSEASWNLVFLHHPPYSSGGHRSHELLQWPYAEWGADAVIAGHNHVYERIERDGMLYFTNGLGGKSHHQFRKIQPDWVHHRVNTVDGAMRVEATEREITFQFWDRFGVLHDSYTTTVDSDTDDSELHSASAQNTVSAQLSHASHDAVQDMQSGEVHLIDYVLKIGRVDEDRPSMTGLRFSGVEIPPGVEVIDAYIEFTNHRDIDTKTFLTISGEKSCSAMPFAPLPHALTSRAKTDASIQWNELEDWEYVGESHRTENLASIVQEIVNYQGWQSGNAMAFYLHGRGERHAVSFELQPKMAPQLHVTFEKPAPTPTDTTPDIGLSRLQASIYLPMVADSRCVLD